ncbi:XdhC/CoxI family protein [Acaryochloris sp. IP29b_bin.137]|uniref:XdhC family protein n=1 Tax=Acaryochloris sp. IP29b_bin.137 TaxID=2969217 RepID=UPI0026166556|nr:XdhC/CoxI family protein [Acaryochloris sp. IP29b_bin.137]
MRDLQEIIPFVAQADPSDPSVILATVVRTGEEVYGRLGARILLTECDQSTEAICDGYVDSGVIEQAKTCCRRGVFPYLHQCCYCDRNPVDSGYSHAPADTTTILFERLNSVAVKAQFDFITECYQEHQAGAIATVIGVEGAMRTPIAARLFLKMDGSVANHIEDSFLTNLIFQDTVKILAAGQTRIQTYPFIDGVVTALVEVVTPPVRLLLFGSSAQTAAAILFAKQLGWTVIVYVPPSQEANLHLFPEADETLRWDFENLPEQIQLTPHTAVVLATTTFDNDLALMRLLWSSAVGYLGFIGSSTRIQQLLDRIWQEGRMLTPKTHRRLHSPIGLDIGAETPTETALAIVSEIQAVLKHRTGACLREKRYSVESAANFFATIDP